MGLGRGALQVAVAGAAKNDANKLTTRRACCNINVPRRLMSSRGALLNGLICVSCEASGRRVFGPEGASFFGVSALAGWGACSLTTEGQMLGQTISTESLILAQNERWRCA